MKAAVRAIIIHNDNLLVIRRDKFGKRYYTLPGGHVEMGESTEKALLRELHEETKLHVAHPRLVYLEHSPAPYGDQYIYVVDYVSGVPMLHENSDEYTINKGGENVYTPMWLPLSELPKVPFRTHNLQARLIGGAKSGFPTQVEEYSTAVMKV
jgi:ADP-ribose pyrophosphatase YjhB (NUDIX family)